MILHSYSIEQPLFSYVRDLPDACEVGTVPEGTKRKKRKGNLPKEATDKLRDWFINHLHHPYPTDDEKQELMRQIGLHFSKLQS